MNRVSEIVAIARLRGRKMGPRTIARLVIGALLAANVIAALVAFKPWAGTMEEMEQQAAGLRNRIRTAEQEIARLKRNVAKVEGARADGDRFLQDHIMNRHTLSSTLLEELADVATKAGIKQKGIAFSFEPVEGTENLTRAIMTGDYEGTYSDLMHFLSLLDRSPRFLIIESLGAAPQQTGMLLNVSLKLDAFVRDDGMGAGGDDAQTSPSERAGL